MVEMLKSRHSPSCRERLIWFHLTLTSESSSEICLASQDVHSFTLITRDTKPTPKHLLTQTWWIRGCSAIIVMTPLNIQCLVQAGTLKPAHLDLSIQETERQASSTHDMRVLHKRFMVISSRVAETCRSIPKDVSSLVVSGKVREIIKILWSHAANMTTSHALIKTLYIRYYSQLQCTAGCPTILSLSLQKYA